MKHIQTFESFLNEAKDMVTFSINNDKLDQLLNKSHDRELDYVTIKGDEYYTLPRREFERFIDAAFSKGFAVDYEGDGDSDIYIQESNINEGQIAVITTPYRTVHGKEPRGKGVWAFNIDDQEVFTPSAMDYKDAVEWAKDNAKALKVTKIKVLG